MPVIPFETLNIEHSTGIVISVGKNLKMRLSVLRKKKRKLFFRRILRGRQNFATRRKANLRGLKRKKKSGMMIM